MFGSLSNIKIKGICTVVPKDVVENRDCVDILSERDLKKQIRVTGIEKRHVVREDQTSADLCTLAARQLLERLEWDRDSIGVLIYVSQTPDLDRPSTAFVIQKRLGIQKECIVFDINLGCSGYIGGLISIGSILKTCGGRGLLLVGDGDSRLVREGAGESLLMGDAGTATAIETVEDICTLPYSMYSDGTGYKVLMKEKGQGVKMNAPAVFSFAINEVTESLKTFKANYNLDENEIDYYVFHQAQKLIVDSIVNICDIPTQKVLFSLKDYGNTIGASIPLTICHNNQLLKIRKKVRLLLCGYGIGLSWGCVYVELDTENIMDIWESEYSYE